MSRKSNTQRDIEKENVELKRLVSRLKKQIKKYDIQELEATEEEDEPISFIEEKKEDENFMTFVLLNGEVRKIPKKENSINR